MGNPRQSIIDDFLHEQSRSEEEDEQSDEEVKDVISDLSEQDFSDLEDQGKFAELIKGLAFSENETATDFIAELQDLIDEASENAGIDI